MKTDYAFLDKCTKKELIFFIKQKNYLNQLFTYSDVLYRRWIIKSEEYEKRRKLNSERLNNLDATLQDVLAKQFNNTTDMIEKVELANKMKPYHDGFNTWKKEESVLLKEWSELALLYESIDKTRKKE